MGNYADVGESISWMFSSGSTVEEGSGWRGCRTEELDLGLIDTNATAICLLLVCRVPCEDICLQSTAWPLYECTLDLDRYRLCNSSQINPSLS